MKALDHLPPQQGPKLQESRARSASSPSFPRSPALPHQHHAQPRHEIALFAKSARAKLHGCAWMPRRFTVGVRRGETRPVPTYRRESLDRSFAHVCPLQQGTCRRQCAKPHTGGVDRRGQAWTGVTLSGHTVSVISVPVIRYSVSYSTRILRYKGSIRMYMYYEYRGSKKSTVPTRYRYMQVLVAGR